MTERKEAVRAWAAQWDEFYGPLANTVRRTRKEVMDHMAEAWGAGRGLTVQQAWARAYKRGCRIIPVEIRPLSGGKQEAGK